MRILYNSKDKRHKDPFGTLHPGEACRISISIPASCQTVRVRLLILNEVKEEYAAYSMKHTGDDGAYENYAVSFSLPLTGLYFYYFQITTKNETFSLYRQGYDQTNMEAGDLWQITCTPAGWKTPRELEGSVMYQIFPDRFYQSGNLDLSEKLQPFRVHTDLSDVPEYRPNQEGKIENCDFFGGNLNGIAAKLDYLSELGVKILYLNPIFKAWSNHRYDTYDYKKIDEMLGTEEDFIRLCRLAHERKMKIILDGVFSHTGSDSVYFDQFDRTGRGAYHHPDSPYRSWFEFQSYPKKYTSWWGIETLPCTRETDPSFLEYIVEGEDSVVAHWLRAGADGFRLDVADELPDSFIAALRRKMKEVKPDSFLIGEVWEDASNKFSYGAYRRYFTDGELDSVMNYPFRRAIVDFVTMRDRGFAFQKTVMDLYENYPREVMPLLMNFLSTHDTPRILTALSPDPVPDTREARAHHKMSPESLAEAEKRLFCAVFLQFVLPGIPCIYYGDEIGMEGYEDPFCRAFFAWQRAGKGRLFELCAALSQLRRATRALGQGDLAVETDGEGRVVLRRSFGSECLTAVVNVGAPLSVKRSGELLFAHFADAAEKSITIKTFGFVFQKEELC